jgi:hypothetical protein
MRGKRRSLFEIFESKVGEGWGNVHLRVLELYAVFCAATPKVSIVAGSKASRTRTSLEAIDVQREVDGFGATSNVIVIEIQECAAQQHSIQR